MKTIFSFLIFILLDVTLLISQILPPGISWKKSDRIPNFPINGNAVTTPIDEISEDWWYDHKNSYNGEQSPENFNGFITCGYSRIANFEQEEDNYGCLSATIAGWTAANPGNPGPYTCDDDLYFGNFPGEYYYRNSFQTIGKYDPHGNLEWYKSYNNGWFIRVIQTSDGNYVAVGPTSSTREPDDLYDPIFYNPPANGVFGSDVSMAGCPTTTGSHYGRKINVVKIDPQGEIIWNYIYGVNNAEDAKDDDLVPWDLVEYNISTDSKIRIVGESYLDAGTGLTNGFILDINTDDGSMNWIEEEAPHSGIGANHRKFLAIDKQTVSGSGRK